MRRRAVLLGLVAAVALLRGAAADCFGDPPRLVNGAWDVVLPALDGVVVNGICQERYTSMPAPTATCVGTDWVLRNAPCRRVCAGLPSFPFPGNGTWPETCNSGVPVNGACRGACAAGWYGAPTVRCAAGWSWANAWGKCSLGGACTGPPPLKVLDGVWPVECSDNPPGTPCVAECNPGYAGAYNPPTVQCLADSTSPTKARWATTYSGGCDRANSVAVDNGRGGPDYLTALGYNLYAVPETPKPNQDWVSSLRVDNASCLPPTAIRVEPDLQILKVGVDWKRWVAGTANGTKVYFRWDSDAGTTITLPDRVTAFTFRLMANRYATYTFSVVAIDTSPFAPVKLTQSVTTPYPQWFTFYTPGEWSLKQVLINVVNAQASPGGGTGGYAFSELHLSCVRS